MQDKTPPKDLMIMGRIIGTYTGWDGDDESMVFYDFKPTAEFSAVAGFAPASDDITVHFTMGFFIWYDENGIPLAQHDVIAALRDLPQSVIAQEWQP